MSEMNQPKIGSIGWVDLTVPHAGAVCALWEVAG